MAEEETESELDSEATEESGGGKSKLIIIGVLVVVLGVGGYFGYPYVMNMISPPPDTEGEVVEEKSAKKPALFASLLPPLVVNLRDSAWPCPFALPYRGSLKYGPLRRSAPAGFHGGIGRS